MLSCASWRRVSAPKVPSAEPSSTKTASHGAAVAGERRRELVVEQRDAALLVVDGDDDRDHAARVPRSAGVACDHEPLSSPSTRPSPRVLDARPAALRRAGRPARAGGRILAEQVVSPRRPAAVPELVDGRIRRPRGRPARRAADRRHASPPGVPSRGRSPTGEAIEISTGGVVPEGADTVVPVERVVVRGDRDRGRRRRRLGRQHQDDRRRRACRDAVLAAGRPAHAGATCGARGVRGRERVGLRGARVSRSSSPARSCGRRAPARPGPDLRVERRHARAAALESRAPSSNGWRSRRTRRTRMRLALDRALGADVVVTSGGVSVGPHDLVRRVEARLGVEEVFWGVAMRPGQAARIRRPRPDAGLRPPGNPGLLARRLPPVRRARASRAPGRSRTPPPGSGPASSRPRCGGGRSATTSSGRRTTGPRTARCSTPSSGRSRT